MRIVRSIKSMQLLIKDAKRCGKRVGFVPTMGALHEGHASLMRRCRQENDLAVLSIFVNPKQFGPQEDFDRYPRQMKLDKELARKEKIDIIFTSTVEEMYPLGYLTFVEVERLGDGLCGKFRSGHFRGVATVVAKLLNIVVPDVLYLGQKDAQQWIVLRRMIRDLNFSTHVCVCPTVREKDGLAMSSRNAYLNEFDRRQAVVLYRALCLARDSIKQGTRKADKILSMMRSFIQRESSGKIEYLACVNTDTLVSLRIIRGNVLLALAVRFGATRLTDNIIVHA